MLAKITNFFRQNPGLILVTAVYLLTFLLMLPLRDQAFDDDFAYIQTAQRLATTGQLKISEWASATTVFPAIWGALFLKIFGSSIKFLHLSNIVLLYFSLMPFYFLLKRLGLDEKRSTIFTILFFGYPWVFQFSYTAMTDVFYSSLLVIALFFYVRAYQEDSKISYLLGSLFAGLAFLTRQIGFLIPLGMFIILLYKGLAKRKLLVREIIFATAPFTLMFVAYIFWIRQVGLPAALVAYHIVPQKEQFLRYLWPDFLGHAGITNSLYLEIIIQRGTGYLNTILGFLLPILIIYKFNIRKILYLIKIHKREILATTVIFTFVYLVDSAFKSKFSQTIPYPILRYDGIFLDWTIWWQRLVLAAIPFGIVLVAITVKKISSSLFTRKVKPNKKAFKFSLLIIATFITALFFRIAQETYPYVFKYPLSRIKTANVSYITELPVIIKNFFTAPETLDVIRGSWFFLLVLTLVFVFISFLLTSQKLKINKQIKYEVLFISLVAIMQFLVITALAYGFWQQYIIASLPFIIIWLAYITRKAPIHNVRTLIVIFLFIFFSLETARNRYQEVGVKWELGTRLVEKGISPYNIAEAGWAWRPFWFFESTFEEAVRQEGGDKYKTAAKLLRRWSLEPAQGDRYEFIETAPKSSPPSGEVVLASEPFWIFRRQGLTEIIQYKKIWVIKVPGD